MGKIIAIIVLVLIALGAVIAAVFFASGKNSVGEGNSIAEALSSYQELERISVESSSAEAETIEVLKSKEPNITYEELDETDAVTAAPVTTVTSSSYSTTFSEATEVPHTTAWTTKASTTKSATKSSSTTKATAKETTSPSTKHSGSVTKPVPIEAELFGTIEGSIGDYFD